MCVFFVGACGQQVRFVGYEEGLVYLLIRINVSIGSCVYLHFVYGEL